MIVFKSIFLLIAFFGYLVAGEVEIDFFKTPQTCSEQQLCELINEKTLEMCWYFGKDSHFRFSINNNEIYFEICLGSLPQIYDDFVSRVKPNFIQTKSGQFFYSYKLNSTGYEETNIPKEQKKEEHPDKYSYIVADRRVINDAHPSLINQSSLERIIEGKNVLFYTGAGLSRASGIPAMEELNELLGLETEERFLFSLENAIESPLEFADKIRIFHDACLYSIPTPAHYALKDMSVYKSTRLITENLDILHEASGIFPYRVDPQHLREEVGGQSIAQYDYIICIGLSFDDRGFLGWYKEQNPAGKIIAVDFFQPSYLGNEDYWLISDLQTSIPNIRNEIFSNEKEQIR